MIALRRSLAALLLLAAACAGSPASSAPAPRGDPNVITKEEMQNSVILSMDALKAIHYLRPTFFRTSGPQSFSNTAAGGIQFSQDFGPLRPASELATVRTDLLYEVRYLNINDATLRFGINANGGPVIVLLSNKQP
ncbi:MAG: hypothetical protein ABI625_13135, partial [bacterium]